MSGLGGRREGAGRKPGVPNKASGAIKEAAQVWGVAGLERLALLAGLVPGSPSTEPGATQVAAIRELLDRGYGKATTILGGDPDNPVAYVIRGPAPVNSVEEWLKLRPQQAIDADINEG
ncbi:MAG TPA: hypothetical protein VGI78_02245 [Acetobacteraceae bacterium]|jgi:hypothetical protein